MQNPYRRNDTETPVHFVYEVANCRLFYTPETVLSVTKMWNAVTDVAWNSAQCVPGSTVNEHGTIWRYLTGTLRKGVLRGEVSTCPGRLRERRGATYREAELGALAKEGCQRGNPLCGASIAA